jgi:ornithine decarboxylase
MKTKAKFLMSKSKVLENYKELKELADIVSYSYKTNRHAAYILQDETNSAFCVHSIKSVKDLNDKSRLWFFAQAWSKEEINELITLGVNNFVVDNVKDLQVLTDNIKSPINLLLRMRLKEHTIHTGRHFVYGMYSKQINELIPKLRKNELIKLLGIHFHRKTQNVGEWSLKQELSQTLSKETLESINLLNIGGGIPAEYKNFRPEIKQSIFNKIKELREWLKSNNIKMIIEPGRFIAASAVKLETNIVNIYDNNIIIDASVYNSAMDTYFAHIRLLVEDELESGTAYTIKGCTPDSIDIFRYKVFLDNPKTGDKIIFLNAGAYNYSTSFCGLKELPTIIIN